MPRFNSQTSRILEVLLDHHDREVCVLQLHRAGSGKDHGFVASMSRRISDCRKRGYHITCRKDLNRLSGQIWTYYTLHSLKPVQVKEFTHYGQGEE